MHTYRKWVPPVSTAIPDIHGWLADISSAREIAERLIQETENKSPEGVLIDALSAAAIVRYCRCFTTGRRERLRIEKLPSTTTAETALHERICGIRNWHISHPVNEQEAHAIYVIVDETVGATTGALGLSSQATAQIPLEPFEAREVIALCDRWIGWLKEQLKLENDRLMPLLIPLSRKELLSLPQEAPQYNEDIHAKR